MTTIAWDGYDLAADSKCVADTSTAGFINKLWPWKHGWFAVAGRLSHYTVVKHYLDTGKMLRVKGHFHSLIWDERQGIMFDLTNPTWLAYPAPCPTAGGSGEVSAMTILLAGGSAYEAVEAAARVDINTGGPIQKVSLRKRSDGKYAPDYSRLTLKPTI